MTRRTDYWWCLVDRKDPDHILFTAPTAQALADKLGLKVGTILKSIWQHENGRIQTCRYRKIRRTGGSRPYTISNGRFWWVECTTDKYEYTVNVCDTVQELSRVTGKSVENIRTIVCKGESGAIKHPRFRRVLKV